MPLGQQVAFATVISKGKFLFVVDSLFIVDSIVWEGFVFGHCFIMQFVLTSFAIISLMMKELVALL